MLLTKNRSFHPLHPSILFILPHLFLILDEPLISFFLPSSTPLLLFLISRFLFPRLTSISLSLSARFFLPPDFPFQRRRQIQVSYPNSQLQPRLDLIQGHSHVLLGMLLVLLNSAIESWWKKFPILHLASRCPKWDQRASIFDGVLPLRETFL